MRRCFASRAQHAQRDGELVSHGAAAKRKAPEFRDAVGHLGIHPHRTDGRAHTAVCFNKVRAQRAVHLGGNIQKPAALAEGADKIVARPAGHAGYLRVRKAQRARKHLVQRAVAAAGIQAHGRALLRPAARNVFGLARAGGALHLRRKPKGPLCLFKLRQKKAAGIRPARHRVYDKNVFHDSSVFSSGTDNPPRA